MVDVDFCQQSPKLWPGCIKLACPVCNVLLVILLQGKWKAREIPNPNYFEDKEPYKMQPIVSGMHCTCPKLLICVTYRTVFYSTNLINVSECKEENDAQGLLSSSWIFIMW